MNKITGKPVDSSGICGVKMLSARQSSFPMIFLSSKEFKLFIIIVKFVNYHKNPAEDMAVHVSVHQHLQQVSSFSVSKSDFLLLADQRT